MSLKRKWGFRNEPNVLLLKFDENFIVSFVGTIRYIFLSVLHRYNLIWLRKSIQLAFSIDFLWAKNYSNGNNLWQLFIDSGSICDFFILKFECSFSVILLHLCLKIFFIFRQILFLFIDLDLFKAFFLASLQSSYFCFLLVRYKKYRLK